MSFPTTPDLQDSELLLRVLRDQRCDGAPAERWLARPDHLEGLLTVVMVNMGQTGLTGRHELACSIDHAAEVLQAPHSREIEGMRMVGLAQALGQKFLTAPFRARIKAVAAHLSQAIEARHPGPGAPGH
ncbi:MAG: hypothetical protein OXE86_09270 [Alphaproteobacteria bacterium]|nr:hypothetical protein [Alphaproteobacteria bacterium]